ncbi:CHAT domain-containing protein [Mariniflexile gromovii]|uniref:CHAT domain-containing protein n=1 Tax=Mariniflexile gromovii TaxID=362523 RepID=A0ABS4BWB9_9FLAO|nr:CHAT domain-containing protein [Mariniflexile gromovii]MBP0904347.1 CHAT domain-containing protein [Mariniflexile gromovii]
MAKTAKILGIEHDVKSFNHTVPNTLEQQFELKSYIEVTSNRAANTVNTITLEENDLIAIQFTDNTEWIGHPEDVQAIYDEKTVTKRSLYSEDYIFDIQIISEDANRGVIKRALVKVFSVFTPKKVAEVAIMELAKSYDKKIQPNPDLYQIDSNLKRIKYTTPSNTSKPFLLLLHGTLSTSIDAFYNLNNNNSAWDDIVAKYGSRIWALEHYTLSVSPLQNALDFLKACPTGCTIDIISHSRGGLVADILAKCDHRNTVTGFNNKEIDILKSGGEKAHWEYMEAINMIAKSKKLTVNKVIRVAAPASGTTILSRRADHFFNLFLNAVSIAFGIANPLYHSVKAFLLELVSQKDDPEVLPGLNAMMPESMFQKMMNISGSVVESDLYNIAGDSEVGGINFSSLKVILANLFYREANDLVVDTRRMEHGVVRKNGFYKHISQGSDTNHFNYFSENGSCAAILEALHATNQNPVTLYTKSLYIDGERGILLDALSLKGVRYAPTKITRDVVIIVPGIMGSTISQNGDHLWVDMRKINDGGIAKNLNISASNVEASGVIEKYYNDLAEHLLGQYDVITMEFDWRKSLKDAAKILKDKIETVLKYQNIKVHIIAHSMGGLLVRQFMMNFPNVWTDFSQNESNKFIMLGTPWLGSYLIMEVLTGHSSRVKQLAAIDFKNNRADLLKVFWKYPGIFELMPIEEGSDRDFWDPNFWKALDKETELKDMPNPDTNTKSLSGFKDYRKDVLDYLKTLEEKAFKNIYYICGQADKTVFDYSFENRFLSRKKKLVYKATSFGDGSVTWASGIPKQLLNSNRLYYTQISHGDLANDSDIFHGISEILSTGSTNALSTQKPALRGGEIISEVYDAPEPAYNSDAVINAIFDIKKQEKTKNSSFNVKVIHGDLRVASYPVMVGHFFMDLILSAEKALDEYLERRLTQRMSIGHYPGQVGESEVFFNLNTQPKGAIVCGLGSTEGLTHYLLSNAVKQATLKYAMFMRDNYTLSRAKKYAKGISFVLIGSGYGKLTIEDSVKGILLGVAKANKQIIETKEGLQPIQDIEIINYYESFASEAYFSLSRQQGTDDRIPFILNKGITKRAGAKKRRMFHTNEYDWWYNLHINSLKNEDKTCNAENEIIGFKYYSSSNLARVEQEMVGIGLFKINHLLKETSTSSSWDIRLSKSLFEMLVPNDFKSKFRDQTNLILKLDKYAAQIPWELLHDNNTSETPAAVTSSFIRQLVTEDSIRYNQVSLNNIEALIVGDPMYNQKELPPLQAAKAEAEWVAVKLKKAGYNTNALINSNAKNIMMELFSKHYKIMHFAGHGVYDPEHCNVGIAIGNGICIDPAMINQIGYVPDFIFINCCYSGVLDAEDDLYSKNRNRLAANIGTQLIEMGVKAIIISGWAVNDGAAKVFSETFYERMFQGYNFGTAVQMARFECYQKYRSSNTWGAYQCYGNQFYKFKNRTKSNQNNEEYVVASQIHTDLDNLLISIRDKKEDKNSAQMRLDKFIALAQESNLLDAMVLEKEAMIYDELGMSDVAYEKYTGLFKFDNGNYSIKALEQYCVVLATRLKNDIDEAKKSRKANAVNDVITKYISNVEFLTLAGRNSRRLNIVGNTYKHTAKYLEPKKEIEYLNIAFEYYSEALDATDDRFSGQYLDALSNMVFIAFILENLGGGKLLNQLQKNKTFKQVRNLEEFLENFYKELDDFDKADLDISVLIGMTEVSYAILLINPNNKNHQEETILMWYRQIFQQIYSPRYISIEIEQIEFLLHYVKNATVKKCLALIEKELKNY